MKRETPVNAEKVGRMSKAQQQFKAKYVVKNTSVIAYNVRCMYVYEYSCV